MGVQKGTPLWYFLNASQSAAGTAVWNGGALMLSKDLLTYILERVPELRISTGASVLLTVPTGPRPNIGTSDMYSSWTKQVRCAVYIRLKTLLYHPSYDPNLSFPSNRLHSTRSPNNPPPSEPCVCGPPYS